MEMSGAGATSTQAAASSLASESTKTLGKESFLNLLITQMRHQDPLNPMDNTEFVAQLAQFSSLEQMQNLNDKLEASMKLTQSTNNTAAAGLIGREVRAAGDTVQLTEDGSVEMGYFLPTAASEVTVMVYDSGGTLVRTYQSQDGDAGSHRLDWDGCNTSGERLDPGKYTFKVTATDADGASVNPVTVVQGVVEGISYENGVATLIVDGRDVSFSDLLEVSGAK